MTQTQLILFVVLLVPVTLTGMCWYLSMPEKFCQLVSSREDKEFINQAIVVPSSKNWIRNQDSRERLQAISPVLYHKLVRVYYLWTGSSFICGVVVLFFVR